MTAVPTPAPPAPPDRRVPVAPWPMAAAVGTVAVLVAMVAGWATAEVIGVRGPLTAVGDGVVDLAPDGVRRWAIDVFGTADKAALVLGTAVILWLVAVGVVRVGSRHRALLVLGPLALGLVGVVAAATGSDGAGAIWPPLVAAGSSAVTCWLLVPAPAPRPLATATERRDFIVRTASIAAATAVAAVVGGLAGAARRRDLDAAAGAVELPLPADPAGPRSLVDAASVGHGVEPFLTPNDDFYRIDTALIPPRVALEDWRLRVGGMVRRPLEISFAELLDRPLVERDVTLTCVSNEVGGHLVGNARWLGVPLAELLEEAGPDAGAEQVASRSVDGWTCGFPLDVALDERDALVAVGMNGEPLPVRHGFPARLIVPGLYGYVSATKWLEEIELTTWDGFDGYWVPRGWAKEGPIKTSSRIDVPARGAVIPEGRIAVAGVAWAQRRGIEAVEVRVDDGPWRRARLAGAVSVDTWRQWVFEWDAEAGSHRLSVRAVDGTGETQTGEPAEPAPDGAQGWHTIRVEVT